MLSLLCLLQYFFVRKNVLKVIQTFKMWDWKEPWSFFSVLSFVIESPLVNLIWVSSHLRSDQTFNLNVNKNLVPCGKIEYCYIFWTLSLTASDGQYCCSAPQLLSGDGTLNLLAKKESERECEWGQRERGGGRVCIRSHLVTQPASKPSDERNLSNGTHLQGNLIVLWGESLLSFPVTNSKPEMDRKTGCGRLSLHLHTKDRLCPAVLEMPETYSFREEIRIHSKLHNMLISDVSVTVTVHVLLF